MTSNNFSLYHGTVFLCLNFKPLTLCFNGISSIFIDRYNFLAPTTKSTVYSMLVTTALSNVLTLHLQQSVVLQKNICFSALCLVSPSTSPMKNGHVALKHSTLISNCRKIREQCTNPDIRGEVLKITHFL